jgi:hypothetical protein
MAPPDEVDQLLVVTRELIHEARAVMDGGDLARSAARSGVLGQYEALCRALDGIDPVRVRMLLGRIAEHVERLNELQGDVERLRRLRKTLRAS